MPGRKQRQCGFRKTRCPAPAVFAWDHHAAVARSLDAVSVLCGMSGGEEEGGSRSSD